MKSQQSNRKRRKEPNKNFRNGKYKNQIKMDWMGSKNGDDRRVSELEDRSTKIIQYENRGEKLRREKLKRASGTSETIPKGLSSESQKNRRKLGEWSIKKN